MSISELGSLGEFISSIAVLVTLIYLVFQIRQNTLSIRSQSRYNVLEAMNSDARQFQEPEVWDLRARVGSGEASDSEQGRWRFVVTGWLSHLEVLFLEIADGALPKTFEDTLRWRIAATFVVPGARETWETLHGYYTGGFQKYVDSLLQEDVDAIYASGKHY
jgi:hypothetical protein